MNYILMLFALLLSLALVRWIDTRNRADRQKAESMYNCIFGILGKISWEMTANELREVFADKDFVATDEHQELTGSGYIERNGGNETFVGFFFPQRGEGKLVRIDFYLLSTPPAQYNLLFSLINDIHGVGTIEGDGDKVAWDLGDAILTFETLETGEAVIQAWSKQYYLLPR
jgi:hypothetical protein